MLADDTITRRDYDILLSRALRLTGDRDQALDLVHDTIERCLRRPPREISGGGLLPWLFVVMRRLFIDAVRSPRSRWYELTEAEVPRHVPVTEQEDCPLWQMFRSEDIPALLLTMPGHLRRPYEMHVVEEMSYQAIARILDITIGTVGTRISRARGFLRNALLNTVPPAALEERAVTCRRPRRRNRGVAQCSDEHLPTQCTALGSAITHSVSASR